MAFLKQNQVSEIKAMLVSEKSKLGKIYNARKSPYQYLNIDHSLIDEYLKQGWEIDGKSLKTKTKIKKLKSHSKKFEDDVWCQFYNLGFRTLNFDENFILPFSKNEGDTKRIDVVAMNDECVFLIECRSSENFKKAPSFKDEFEVLRLKIDGLKKAIWQILGRNIKVKYVFATRNLRLSSESEDYKSLIDSKSFYYNNNTHDYINNLIKTYKNAAFYQFLGMVFKNEIINQKKIEIPALKGEMGKKDYYMFSIEPSLLLKMGFVLHRTKANESEFPTYQRLLVPTRLKGITKFIDNGGFFPNSIIINFNSKKNKILFEPHSKDESSNSCSGTLKIPNSYGIAYIIDGQHRVYGYANSIYIENNTIPVVAFDGLDTIEQLEMFMDINQNQKAVSPSLRLDLEEDLFWDSERADSRLKALKSSITKQLANSESSPLFNKISVGEDKSSLTFKPFTAALTSSGLLPSASGNKYKEDSLIGSLFDTSNNDNNNEMKKAKKRIVDLLITAYDYVEDNFPVIYRSERNFIISNRGTFAFISLIGSINKFETQRGIIDLKTTNADRFNVIEKYLKSLFEGLNSLSKEEADKQFDLLGAGADTKWLRFFQTIINSKHPEFNPTELIDWKERQNEEYQNQGRNHIKLVEKHMKKIILNNLKILFDDNWELEINKIKTACQNRANDENEKNYKESIPKRVDWTEMFSINDYKEIIEKYWTRKPENNNEQFVTFEKQFSIEIGDGKNKKDVLKWISFFNSYRNQLAHEGSKDKGINKEEAKFLEKIYSHFYP